MRVLLVSGQASEFDPPPGRVLLAPPSATFEELAEAIDLAFARYDRSHLHVFRLRDGRELYPDAESVLELGGVARSGEMTIQQAGLEAIERFTYVFDLGDDWTHECSLMRSGLDPSDVWGKVPDRIVAVDGWGWLPDQYGREEPAD